MKLKNLTDRLGKTVIKAALAAAVVTAVPSLQANAAAVIPEDAVIFNGHSYKIYDVTGKWADAQKACESVGGHLVTITSAAEQEFLNSYAENNAALNVYWIGLRKSNGKKWVTGEKFEYSNIEIEESGQYFFGMYGKDSRNITGVTYSADRVIGAWYDHDNTIRDDYWDYTKTGYICEWDGVDLKHASVTLSKQSYVYDGSSQMPAVTVAVDGNTLQQDTDYTVSYSSNTDPGTAVVTVTGKGSYAGQVQKTFTITVKTPGKVTGLVLNDVTKNRMVVYWKPGNSLVSGYEIEYWTGSSAPKTIRINKRKVTKGGNYKKHPSYSGKNAYKLTKLKKNRTYKVRVRAYRTINGKRYYGKWSKVKSKKTKK